MLVVYSKIANGVKLAHQAVYRMF